ncbi:MAG: DNA polymerase IV [Sphaerochaetaceae bacterium]
METVFFHVDMDAFFASVEQLDHPEYRGLPVIVGGLGARGVVSTCSYEARAFGVHSAMPMFQAHRLCPQAIYVQGRMQRYSQMSQQIVGILSTFSPDVQQISIDEAFLDMTGTERLFGKPRETAVLLKKRVKDETGLIISVGIGQSRFIAKMASGYRKPDGLCRVSPGREIDFIDAVGLRKLWGIGESSLAALSKHHITTTAQLRSFSMEYLQHMFGKSAGAYYYQVSRGIDPGIYTGETKSHSISSEITFSSDITDEDILNQYLLRMSHEVMFRSLREQVIGTTVGIKVRFSDFSTTNAQVSPVKPIYSAEEVFRLSKELLHLRWKPGVPVRLLGVGLYQTQTGDTPLQEELFEDSFKRKRELEKAVLGLKTKGRNIVKASTIAQGEDGSGV